MKRRSGQVPRIRLLSAEAVLLLTLCLIGAMFCISAFRSQLVRQIAHSVHRDPAHFQQAIPRASGMGPAAGATTKPVRRIR